MAKNPFWLRGAKGKIAGVVAMKGEKGTVIRENVKPANPQTNGQMLQRIIFGSVTQAAKVMLPIIGISFEGYGSEKLNRRRFVQLNCGLLKTEAKFDNEGFRSKLSYTTKNVSQLIPNPYRVSDGSLDTPEVLKPKIGGTTSEPTLGNIITDPVYLQFGKTYTPYDMWELLFGIGKGQQVTYPFIEVMTGNVHAYDYEETDGEFTIKDFIRYSRFSAPRLVLKTEDVSDQFNIVVPANPTEEDIQEIQSGLRLAMWQCIDFTKSDTNLASMLCLNIDELTSVAGRGLALTLAIDWTELELEGNWRIAAIGVIVSKQNYKGEWQYNNSTMQVLKGNQVSLHPNYYYGLTKVFAINNYLPSASRNQNYLQTGGEGGNI